VTEGEVPAHGEAEEERDEVAGSRRFAAAAGPKEIADRAAGAAVHPSWAMQHQLVSCAGGTQEVGWGGKRQRLFGEQGAAGWL
jgi:hypothetical protein